MVDSAKSGRQRWLQRIRRRLQLGLFLKSFVDWVVVFCLLAGCLLLATKLFWPDLWPFMLWSLLAVIPVIGGAWLVSRRNPWHDDQSVAMLDRRIGAGGLLMTLVETPDDQWEDHLPAAEQVWRKALPTLRPVRAIKHLIVPVAFLLVTCLIPPRTIQSLQMTPSTVSTTEVARLENMLHELDERDVLSEEDKDELEEEIEKLARETRFNPLTHENWETVDALQQKMDLKLANRQNQLLQAAGAISALQQSLDNSTASTDSEREQLEQMMEELMSPGGTNDSQSAGREGEQSGFEGLDEFAGNGDFRLPSDPEALRRALAELGEFIEGQCENIGDCMKPCNCEGCKDGGL